MRSETYETASADETMARAQSFAESLGKGSVVALYGDLGVGKSVFCKGIAVCFGVPETEVRSPSFTILNVYPGDNMVINHFDLYRIENVDELLFLGFEDHIYSDAVSLIEWSERLGDELPAHAIKVYIEQTGDESRK